LSLFDLLNPPAAKPAEDSGLHPFGEYLAAGAIFSKPEPTHRYFLWRTWALDKPRVLWTMLNPSDAGATSDDPTVKKVVGFSKLLGVGGADVVNLYAFCATDPRELKRHSSGYAIGEENDQHILEAASKPEVDRIVCAWGNDNPSPQRALSVINALRAVGKPIYCLGLTGQGIPRHPGRIAYSTPFVPLPEGAR
jgi:hypothetical protein